MSQPWWSLWSCKAAFFISKPSKFDLETSWPGKCEISQHSLHRVACTELLFRMELCFNCWELFHHGNLASAIRLLAIQPKIYKCRQLVLFREYQGADKFVFIKNGLVSSLPSCLASSLCVTTTKNYMTIQTSFMHHYSLKKTCNSKTTLDMQVKLTHTPCFGRWVYIVPHTWNAPIITTIKAQKVCCIRRTSQLFLLGRDWK